MTLEIENSDTCFKRLVQESSSGKFHKSLEYIRKACDAIEQMNGVINYSKVAVYTDNHFGNPKRQTIMNNSRLRLYIDLRRQESSTKPTHSPKQQYKSNVPDYPTSNLDTKTKSYIDQLKAENVFLNNSIKYLKEEVLQETRKNPISLIKSISQGPNEDLSMELATPNLNQDQTKPQIIAIGAIEKLLALANNPDSYLKIQVKNERRVLVLETPGFIGTILFEDELMALENLITEEYGI